MRWLPTLFFSPSNNSSSSATAAAAVDNRKKARLFGTRTKKFRHVADNEFRSPPRWQDSDEDPAAPLSQSPTGIRSSTSSSTSSSSAVPHPLPLPEDAALLRHRDGDCRLPSPKDVPGATVSSGGCRGLEDRDRAGGAVAVDGAAPSFRMRR